jgi:uncharacterized circularly permuted ATP-grasp superfamily protein
MLILSPAVDLRIFLSCTGKFRSCFATFGRNLDVNGGGGFSEPGQSIKAFFERISQNYQTSKDTKYAELDLLPVIYSAEDWNVLSSDFLRAS